MPSSGCLQPEIAPVPSWHETFYTTEIHEILLLCFVHCRLGYFYPYEQISTVGQNEVLFRKCMFLPCRRSVPYKPFTIVWGYHRPICASALVNASCTKEGSAKKHKTAVRSDGAQETGAE